MCEFDVVTCHAAHANESFPVAAQGKHGAAPVHARKARVDETCV